MYNHLSLTLGPLPNRFFTGCGCDSDTPNIGRALSLFHRLTFQGAAGPKYIFYAPESVRTRANSAAAWAHWQCGLGKVPSGRAYMRAAARRGGVDVSSAERLRYAHRHLAMRHANAAVRGGLVSAAVIEIGHGMDEHVSEPGEREAVAELFAAVKEASRDFSKRETRWKEKIAENPAAYACAAEGCEVKGRHQSALRRCAGICPHDMKPHYCSKECQKKVSGLCSAHCSRTHQ